MANKRYDQYGAGTYDTSKIFLQGDDTTGALEKVFLPVPGARFCKFSAAVLINANNTGSNPETLGTIVIPANTISTAADVIEINFIYSYLTASGTKTVQISCPLFPGFSTTATAANTYNIFGFFSRISSTHSLGYWRGTTITSSVPFTNLTNTTCDFTINNTVTLSVTAGAANDIFTAFCLVRVFAAA